MSTLTIATLVVIAIVLVFFVMPLGLSARSKLILALITLLAPGKSYLHFIVGGDAFDPKIPYNLTFVFDLARTTLIFLALLTLVRLALNLLYRLVRLNFRVSLLPTASLFHAQLMVLCALALACYGTSCAYEKPELKHYECVVERLDPRLDGMKIIMLSDLHISAPTDANAIYQLVQEVNAVKPDLILLPGDLMDGALSQRRAISDLLFDLKAKFGVYISAGNHEYYSGYQQWRTYFEQGGLISLDNKVVALKDQQGKVLLNLGGLTDPRAARYNLPTPDVTGVVAALDASAPSIILSHRPQYAVDLERAASSLGSQNSAQTLANFLAPESAPVTAAPAPQKQVDIVLSGHTHGGLVWFLRDIVAKANGGFVSGYYQINKTNLIVGNGTMVWMGFPLRLGVPSQVIELILHSKTQYGPALPMSQRLTAAAERYQVTAPQPAATQPHTADSGSDLRLPQDLASIDLMLPMVDTTTGKFSNELTKLVLLPERITKDQLRRINAILTEQPPKPQEPSIYQDKASGVRVVEMTNQALKSTPQTPTTEEADDINDTVSLAELAAQMSTTEEQSLLNDDPNAEGVSATLELQAEYAISLDPNQRTNADSSVSDLLQNPEAAEPQPKKQAPK